MVFSVGLSGCGRVPNRNSKETQALFKRLGFEDKDQDGMIEKKSVWNLWTDEKYTPDADIDGDGKILSAEAKYYLRNLETIPQQDKDKFPFTCDDTTVLLVLINDKLRSIRSVKDPGERIALLWKLASGMAIAKVDKNQTIKVIEEVLDLAKYVKDKDCKDTIITGMTLDMVKAGFFKEAISLIKSIDSFEDIVKTIHAVIPEIEKSGLDMNIQKELFKDILQVVIASKGTTKGDLAKYLIPEMFKIGLLEETLELPNNISEQGEKETTFETIASEITRSGLDKSIKIELFKKLLMAVPTINWPFYETRASTNIEKEMVNVGLNRKERKKIFKDAGIKSPVKSLE